MGLNDQSRKGIRHNTSRGDMEISSKIQNQQCIHLSVEKIVLRPACHRLDRHGERGVQDRRESKQGDPLSSLLSNSMLQFAMEDDMKVWREKGMGFKLGDEQRDCISNLRFADDVPLPSSSLGHLKKVMSDFKRSTEKIGLEVHVEPTKRSANRRYQGRNGISKWKGQVSGTNQHVRATRDDRNKTQDQNGMGIFCRIQTGFDIQILPAPTQTTLIRRRQHAIDVVRCRHKNMNA